MHYLALFSILFKKLTKHALFIARLYENDNLLENLRKFSKIAKNALFLAYFSINLTNHSLIFSAIGRKRQVIGNFE
ncbi:MAG: hypothetical protein FD143_3778 [Ignavibacteria bacterium]|nr:MAG: hypothetical protein FD143_3778 [Ignavibacteria bacterium]